MVMDTELMARFRKRRPFFVFRFLLAVGLWFFLGIAYATAEPSTEATAAFTAYVQALESKLAKQHQSAESFLPPFSAQNQKQLHQGDLIIDPVTPEGGASLPGAMLHDWRGTAFAAGAKGADFERLMKDVGAYPQRFAPQVLSARVLAQQGDHLQITMRVRQHHVITVVLDTDYDINFGRLDGQHGYSTSRSIKISEIASPGDGEHALGPDEEHGFLWRLNTYWTYEERDGGLYMQIESVSLTRSIPTGLKWLVQPFVEKVPRDSLEFTLEAVCKALRK
jgi:hypothetical protein